jgi:Rrf2 family transcriptional regulator, iron-sulfur cluster assembly transcription factor
MKLGTKGRYAVMSMVALAKSDDTVPLSLVDLSTKEGISLTYLEQLFLKLRKNGLVSSQRGPGGGYTLARPSQQINVLEVLSAVDESIGMTRCADHAKKGCQKDNARCLTHDLWAGAEQQMAQYFSKINLADICEQKMGEIAI